MTRGYSRLILLICLVGLPSAAVAESLQLGTTFSRKQCEYLGLDWRETYEEVLQLPFQIIRLGAYWDEIERAPGVYEFETLDWQIAQAHEAQVPILLTVGMKAPRWPEFHLPGWLDQPHWRNGDVTQDTRLRAAVLAFVEAVVRRYADDPGIRYWQVENEPLDRSGPGHQWINPTLLREEIALVRQHDRSRRPVILNFATYPHKFLRRLARWFLRHEPVPEGLALGDVVALNIYPVVGHRWPWKSSYYRTSPTERRHYFLPLIRRVQDQRKPVWVTELQAEPWEPARLVYTDVRHPPSSDPTTLRPYVEEMQSLGITTVLLWGAEYWYFRKVRHQDPSWWQAVATLLTDLAPAPPVAVE